MRVEKPAKQSLASAINKFNGNLSPTISVSNISKHFYNCEGTSQLHKFYHTTFFSPAKTTFLDAIKKGYLQGRLGLTYQSAKQPITHNKMATVKGH